MYSFTDINVGIGASYTGSSGNEFEDGLMMPDPNVFNGTYFKWSAGIAGGPGLSYGATKLGGAYSSASLGSEFGYEMSAGISTGTSELQWVKKIQCGCQ